MYNPELKNEYIKNNIDRNNALDTNAKTMFNKSQTYELSYQKDLCNFSTQEILDMYKGFYTSSLEVLMSTNSQFKYYTYYCLNNGLVKDNQNHFEEIDTNLLMNCINKQAADNKVVTREQLLKDIEQLPNVSDQFLVLALFEGFGNKQFEDLVYADLSCFEGNTVTLRSGRTFEVSDKLLELATESADEYTYHPVNGTGRDFDYAEDDYRIIKRLYNAEYTENLIANRKRIYNKLIRIKDFISEPYITQAALNESGRIDLVNKLINDGIYNNVETAILDNDVETRYGKICGVARYYMKFKQFYSRD